MNDRIRCSTTIRRPAGPLLRVLLVLVFLLAVPWANAQSQPAATRFTPVAGDDSVKQLADSLGNTPEERAQILQLAGAGKELFAQKYKGKWANTLAGAMTFLVVASHIVSMDQEPSAAAEAELFASLDAMLAQSEIGRAPNREKTALYNTLLASAGLPLVIYVEGKQGKNDALVGQAKTMAAGFGRKLFNMEMPALLALLDSGTGANAVASAPGAPAARASASGAGLDGRYDCQMNAMQFNGASFVVQYQPTGMWFTIAGNRYSAQSGGGTIDASADVVGFRGGAYDGWRGARRGDAIVFRKDDHANPRAGEGIKVGDFRCGRRSG
ncbi:DUF6683 family protein [Thermomonas sp.]|uniref:DUF6683 family protein n=1 Tax=Thermomonas sp. TaxID=1971895 RepID=UPI0035AE92B9